MTALRTPAQSAASRENGALSRGPATAEGKARSARNGTTHGLASAAGAPFALLPGEDPAEHAAVLADHVARHRPADPAERFWVERLVAAAWRLRRLEALEHAAFAAAREPVAADRPPPPSLDSLARYRTRIERDHRYALGELDRLSALRPSRPRTPTLLGADAARLRWVADRMDEAAAAEAGTDVPAVDEGTGGPGPVPPAPPAAGIGEPSPVASGPLADAAAPARTTEPAAGGAPAPNRAERRRRAALLRRARPAA